MEINSLHRVTFDSCQIDSYQIDSGKIKQRMQQKDKTSAANPYRGDSADISEEGRKALKEKISVQNVLGQTADIGKLSPLNPGVYGILNDFEKIMSELGGGSVSDEFVTKDYSQASVDALKEKLGKTGGTGTDSFDSYVNQMACAYQLLKDRIEEKHAAPDRQKEYAIAADGSSYEITKEQELGMLKDAYETHSRFMAASTEIWSSLRDFKVQTVYHSNAAAAQADGAEHAESGIRQQAYKAFLSAVSEENSSLLSQNTGSLSQVRLNLGISSSARNALNSIWDYYANRK